ncbi:MAG TPA: CBS domain-containing protein [Nordella sp.]|nr:CBS domain-containing protein [Nordella sp.]
MSSQRKFSWFNPILVAGKISPAVTARPDTPVTSLVPLLSNGRTHAVIIVDDASRIVGIVTQTDLLVALSRALLAKDLVDTERWNPLTDGGIPTSLTRSASPGI